MKFDRTSSHMLSMIASIYGVFMYSIAFSLEMWFIITTPVYNYQNYDYEEEGYQTIFAYVLAAVYLVTAVISLLLLSGIIIKSLMCLMAWVITILLVYVPECGLVLYLSIYQWGIDTRNGKIELFLYIIRAIMNIFFVVCVRNLSSQWKTDKQMISNPMNVGTFGTGSSGPDPYPFFGSSTSTTINPVFKHSSSADPGQPHLPTSEFDPRNFQDILFNGSSINKGHPRSTIGTPSEYTSNAGYKGIPHSTQSLDRRKLNMMRSTTSLKDEVVLRPLQQGPFEYLHRPGSYIDMNRGYSAAHPASIHYSHHQDGCYYGSRTLPRDFGDKNSSTHSIRDVAL